jgi:hypothetical protein
MDLIPYYHHGIYISDDEVVEFGGGNLWEWSAIQVRKVSFRDFEKGGKAEVVQHLITWMGLTYSPAGTPEEIIDRARWLIEHQPPMYWLAHRNCEYVANWCATGRDFESFQTKGFMAGKAYLVDIPFLLAMRRFSSRTKILIAVGLGVVTLASAVPYIHDSRLPLHLRTYPGLRSRS